MPDSRVPGGQWWRSAAIYQIYPRSFADGNADGVGDLAGVRAHLTYLAELGVDAVWFNPWYASPQADAGYDVSDYRAIDPLFGTLAEAEALIREAHELSIRIIVDIVPNHCSDEHVWFRQALAEGPGRTVARAVLVPQGPRPPWRTAAEQLGVHLRRTGLDPVEEPRRHPRRVVPAPVRPGPAGPELAAPVGTQGV